MKNGSFYNDDKTITENKGKVNKNIRDKDTHIWSIIQKYK